MPKDYTRANRSTHGAFSRFKTNAKAQMVYTRLDALMAGEVKSFSEEEVLKIEFLLENDETTDLKYDNLYIALTTTASRDDFKDHLAKEVLLKEDPMKDEEADKINKEVDNLAGAMKSFSGGAKNKKQRPRRSTRIRKQTQCMLLTEQKSLMTSPILTTSPATLAKSP